MADQETRQERRRHPRAEIAMLLSYVNLEGGTQKALVAMGRTVDISCSGARVEVYQPLAIGSRMEMELAYKESCRMVQGQVIHITETAPGRFLAGIQFSEVQESLPADEHEHS